MNRPNLFKYAKKELSQDAFLCWLLDWANVACAAIDNHLHQAGLAFLNSLLAKHDLPPVEAPKVNINTQVGGIDIVAEVENGPILLIEDKVDAGVYGDHLARYKEALAERYPGRPILPIYLKTGDQSDYRDVENSGYRPFLREDLLAVLRGGGANVGNSIFIDFLQNLDEREVSIAAYRTKPVPEWIDLWDPWIGFYQELQRHRDLQWAYVANPTGGFYGAWWHARGWRGSEVYLQIEQGPLCFKIAVAGQEKEQWRNLRDSWREAVITAATVGDALGLEKPVRLGFGATMTVAWVKPTDWIGRTPEGLLDLSVTLRNLEIAERLLDQAVLASGTR